MIITIGRGAAGKLFTGFPFFYKPAGRAIGPGRVLNSDRVFFFNEPVGRRSGFDGIPIGFLQRYAGLKPVTYSFTVGRPVFSEES